MGFAEYSDFDGLGLAGFVKKKKVKPAELVEAAIERIERHNPRLNVVVFKGYEEARARATTRLSGPLAGVPMLLKDILGDKKGWPTRRGSRFVPATPSPFNATRVSRFEAAGLIPLGKTNCRNSASYPSRSRSSTGLRVILGMSIIRPAVRQVDRRRRHRSARACQRRRRLDSHPCLVLRPRRA